MPLINTKTMLLDASNHKYGVGAFNFSNLESLQAILEVVKEKNYPVILAVSTSAIRYMGLETLVAMVKASVENSLFPVALHLDHGKTFEDCKRTIDAGFTSVMIDASDLSFEENVALTKKVVDYAHTKNVTVEAELGQLKGVEDEINVSTSYYTNPEQAKQFVELTGVDSLAVSVGTSHGAYKFSGEPKLQIDILKKIKALLPNTPLVLHGASSIPNKLLKAFNVSGGELSGAKGVNDSLIVKAIENGIAKINVDSDLRIAFTLGIRESLKDKKEFNPRTYLLNGKNKIKELLSERIDLFKSIKK